MIKHTSTQVDLFNNINRLKASIEEFNDIIEDCRILIVSVNPVSVGDLVKMKCRRLYQKSTHVVYGYVTNITVGTSKIYYEMDFLKEDGTRCNKPRNVIEEILSIRTISIDEVKKGGSK